MAGTFFFTTKGTKTTKNRSYEYNEYESFVSFVVKHGVCCACSAAERVSRLGCTRNGSLPRRRFA